MLRATLLPVWTIISMVDNSPGILVDSNFFIALYSEFDSLHSPALTVSTVLEKTKQQMIITNFVFHEIVTILSQRQNRHLAVETGNALMAHPFIRILFINELLHKLTWEIFEGIRKKNMSFADCANLAVMQYENIDTILTFDREDFAPLQKQYRFKLYTTE